MSDLWQVISPRFVAGLVVDAGMVTQAAPILQKYVGQNLEYTFESCRAKGWSFLSVDTKEKSNERG